MRYEAEVREATAHFDKQAGALKFWRWGSLVALACASWGLMAGVGLPAMVAFVIAFVYWRDTRLREQYLQTPQAPALSARDRPTIARAAARIP